MGKWVKEEAVFLWVTGLLVILFGIYSLINITVTHYHGILYGLPIFIEFLPLGIGFTLISIYLQKQKLSKRFTLLFYTLGKMYWMYLLICFGCFAIQFTPFHLKDHVLLAFDQSLGFNSVAIYNFTMHHAWIKSIANFSYNSLSIQCWAIPLALSLLLEKKSVRIFFLANIIAVFFAYNLYYYFPATVPADALPNTHFLTTQYYVVAQWYEVHFHLKNAIRVGDLIGFPSYHVIWAMLLTYACINRKWLFYPLVLFNILLVLSTMELGWHYLADVLGGFAVGAISICIARYCVAKSQQALMPSSQPR